MSFVDNWKIIVIFVLLPINTISKYEEEVQQLVEGNYIFSAHVMQEMKISNIIFSPISAESILGLTQIGAGGNSAIELSTALHLPKGTKDKTLNAFKWILKDFNIKSDQYSLTLANKMYISNSFKVKRYFIDIAKSKFLTEIENVDFVDSELTANKINNWIEQRTKGKITDITSPSNLGSDVRTLLINALYFSGFWENEFDKDETKKSPFTTETGDVVSADTMHLTASFLFNENNSFGGSLLKLRYKGDKNISMTIVLPDIQYKLLDIVQKLDKIYEFNDFKETQVTVELPKFTVRSTVNLVPILQKLGVKSIFNAKEADFSIIAYDRELFVNDIVQKTFIKVTEKGTEAAATSVVSFTNRFGVADEEGIHFLVNRPFLFFIKMQEIVLFTGFVVNPNE